MTAATVPAAVRMGFGFAAGMVLFLAVMAAAVIFAIALMTGAVTMTWPFAQPGQTFEGTGSATSVSTTFEAGNYRLEWSATPTSPVACRLMASLVANGNVGVQQPILEVYSNVGATTVGHKQVGLAATAYEIRVDSDCKWSLRFAPE